MFFRSADTNKALDLLRLYIALVSGHPRQTAGKGKLYAQHTWKLLALRAQVRNVSCCYVLVSEKLSEITEVQLRS